MQLHKHYNARKKLESAILHMLGIVGLRNNDVLLSSYPRSGNTWLRFLLCNLISLLEWDGREVTFPVLNQTMVELGANNLLQPWTYSTIPRVVKTHKRYWRVFARAGGAIGIVRDPRDVMVSYYHFKKNRKRAYKGSFAEFIHDRDCGLEAWFRHYSSWRNHWSIMVRYEDIKQDAYGEFNRILNVLGVNYPEAVIQEAIRRSSIQNVRRAEISDVGPQAQEARFARNGNTQQWHPYFSEENLAYYNSLVDEYGIDIYKPA